MNIPFSSSEPFSDRTDAGRRLAQALSAYRNRHTIIYALPRGGVVIGVEVARALHAPLDLIIPRKIGHPLSPEYAIAAVAEDGHMAANPEELSSVDQEWLRGEIERQRAEAKRRREAYLADQPPIDPAGTTAIIVDDGIATGLTIRCAIAELKHRNPQRIVVAVPVAPPEQIAMLRKEVDDVVCLLVPDELGAIGAFYRSFPQVEDAEVISLMHSFSPS